MHTCRITSTLGNAYDEFGNQRNSCMFIKYIPAWQARWLKDSCVVLVIVRGFKKTIVPIG